MFLTAFNKRDSVKMGNIPKLFPNNILQVIGLMLLGFLVTAPLVFLLNHYLKDFDNEVESTLMFIFLCGVIIALAYLFNKRRGLAVKFNFNLPESVIFALSVIGVGAFQISLNLPIIEMLEQKFGSDNHDSLPSTLYVLGALFLAPILEEMICRGIILKGLLTNYSPITAIILSAIIFGAMHGNPIAILGALNLGLIFGWLYYKTKSLGLTMILHFICNLIGLSISYIKYNVNRYSEDSLLNFYGDKTIYIVAVFLIIFITSTYFLLKKIKLNLAFNEEMLKKEKV